MVMHLEYRIRLPDHDWCVAERHKLIPSVYAVIDVANNRLNDRTAVGYSGPTYIAIRSGKHSSSTAFSHAKDLQAMLDKDDFVSYCKLEDGSIKPILIIIVDGGPDENPRYEKVQAAAIHQFKTFDLDAVFIATNAPGRSAFNRVERRMAPLSRELSGLILQHDHYGSHLDESGRTIDADLERENFAHAGETLAEIWGNVCIDSHPTCAEYIKPEESELEISLDIDCKWRSAHVREGHYFLQIIKCGDERCCKPFRSNLRDIVKKFLPAPLVINQREGIDLKEEVTDQSVYASLLLRLQLTDDKYASGVIKEVPFDFICPSIEELIKSRSCKYCSLYHASVKSLKGHLRVCTFRNAQVQAEDPPAPILLARGNRRSVRVAAKRGREKLILWSTRLNDEHADWFEEEDLVGSEVLEEPTLTNNPAIPVIDINNYMTPEWNDE